MLILIWPFQTQLNCDSQPKKRVRARFSLQLLIQAMLWWTNNGHWRADTLVSFLIFNPAPARSGAWRNHGNAATLMTRWARKMVFLNPEIKHQMCVNAALWNRIMDEPLRCR